jgi:hypothetical protein
MVDERIVLRYRTVIVQAQDLGAARMQKGLTVPTQQIIPTTQRPNARAKHRCTRDQRATDNTRAE